MGRDISSSQGICNRENPKIPGGIQPVERISSWQKRVSCDKDNNQFFSAYIYLSAMFNLLSVMSLNINNSFLPG